MALGMAARAKGVVFNLEALVSDLDCDRAFAKDPGVLRMMSEFILCVY